MRQYSVLDKAFSHFDQFLKGQPTSSSALMRVNHSGEVCAQALYLGQALITRDPMLEQQLYQAAKEEKDHLRWCANRIAELGGRTSFLNPLWAIGSFGIGIAAGLCGDKISLGFLAETERQVTRHLERHLQEMPPEDKKSREILTKMREDEERHAARAMARGGIELPAAIRRLMSFCSKIMTITTRYI